MNILIVDDGTAERLLMTTLLRGAGFTDLLTATSAEAALERLGVGNGAVTEASVDLILMDINMAEMTGIEACRRIKETPHLRDVPVIMVTSSVETDDIQAAFAAGALDYITKPPRRLELLARVRSALRLKCEMDAREARERQLLDYVEQAGYVTDAAAAVEAGTFDPATLARVSAREDALGQLARVFERMAGEVAERERVLKAAAHQLHIEIDHARVAREVEQITETDYFQALEDRARCLRGRGSPAA